MKKILVVALSVALLLSTTACGTNSELEALKQENEQLKSQLSDTEEKPTEKLTEKPTEKPTEKSEEQKTSDTQPNSDSTYELTAGSYEIPNDVPSGKYDLVAVSGHGTFKEKDENGYNVFSEWLGVDSDQYYTTEYKNAKLTDGKTVEISGTLKVQLIPKN